MAERSGRSRRPRRAKDEPHSLDAEQALLGALMLEPGAWARASELVERNDLYTPDHKLIFAAIAELVERNEPPDAVTVVEHLKACGQVGLGRYVAQLVEDTPSAANIEAYARIVRDHSRRRRVMDLAAGVQTAAAAGGTAAELEVLVADACADLQRVIGRERAASLRSVGIAEFLNLELPKRENLLAPWLQRQGINMLYAYRGVGKTYVALSIGWAVATSGAFLRWRASRPAGVLYVDGELPAVTLQERLAKLTIGAPAEGPTARFDLLTPDLQQRGMPDLASLEGQRAIDACVLPEHELIIVDNLSSLVRSGKENEAEHWSLVQEWALRHRKEGRAILFIHHAGKNGAQRGTSRREDVLDVVIQLRRPLGCEASEGARFEVVFEKARGLCGADVETFEAALVEGADGNLAWTTKSSSRTDQIVSMAQDGMKPAEIASELGIGRATVYRQIKAAVEEGLLPDNVVKLRPRKED